MLEQLKKLAAQKIQEAINKSYAEIEQMQLEINKLEEERKNIKTFNWFEKNILKAKEYKEETKRRWEIDTKILKLKSLLSRMKEEVKKTEENFKNKFAKIEFAKTLRELGLTLESAKQLLIDNGMEVDFDFAGEGIIIAGEEVCRDKAFMERAISENLFFLAYDKTNSDDLYLRVINLAIEQAKREINPSDDTLCRIKEMEALRERINLLISEKTVNPMIKKEHIYERIRELLRETLANVIANKRNVNEISEDQFNLFEADVSKGLIVEMIRKMQSTGFFSKENSPEDFFAEVFSYVCSSVNFDIEWIEKRLSREDYEKITAFYNPGQYNYYGHGTEYGLEAIFSQGLKLTNQWQTRSIEGTAKKFESLISFATYRYITKPNSFLLQIPKEEDYYIGSNNRNGDLNSSYILPQYVIGAIIYDGDTGKFISNDSKQKVKYRYLFKNNSDLDETGREAKTNSDIEEDSFSEV